MKAIILNEQNDITISLYPENKKEEDVLSELNNEFPYDAWFYAERADIPREESPFVISIEKPEKT